MKEFWDKRYSEIGDVYGEFPNQILKTFVDGLEKGKVLLPGEGEGRNAIYLAQHGWQVEAFDYSPIAKKNTVKKANSLGLEIIYNVSSVEDFEPDSKYDLIALVYLHLEPQSRVAFHKKIQKLLRPNGFVFIQAFAKEQIGLNSGGPKNEMLLYSVEDLKSDFKELNIIKLQQQQIELNEGIFHTGIAENITFIGQLK